MSSSSSSSSLPTSSSLPAQKKVKKSALEALRSACADKQYRSFANLSPGSYLIEMFQRVSSINGGKIRVDFFDYFMYLPKRFSNILSDKLLTDLSVYNRSVVMIYSGKGQDGRLLLDFDVIKLDSDYDV